MLDLAVGRFLARRGLNAQIKRFKDVYRYIISFQGVSRCGLTHFYLKIPKNHLKSVAQRNIILIMTDRTHKNKISDLESDLDQKKSENAKNTAKSRKLKNELKRQTDSIASAKSQVCIF